MCPLCAAKYKYVRETKDNALIEDLLTTVVSAGDGSTELPVLIAGSGGLCG